MSADPDRRPLVVRCDALGYFIDFEAELQTLGPLTETELRWLGLVLIPAALPPLPVPGLENG